MAKGLTVRQREILEYVHMYVENHGYPPSIREIGSKFNIGSLRGVTVHLDALAKKGAIERNNTPRSIKVTHPRLRSERSGSRLLPLVGSIAAGTPIAAEEHVEALIPVPSDMVRNIENAFLLRVRGDSMTGEGIMPRDLVVIKPQRTAHNNELVAVMLDGEATVKRLSIGSEGARLMPSNPAYDPIPVRTENHQIIGKVIGLIRDYEGMAF